MGDRLKLHEELCSLLGSRNVYFQPPESLKMNYPCIRYNLSNRSSSFANDSVYEMRNQYNIIVIDRDPDSTIDVRLLTHFKYCTFTRYYTADNLNHYQLRLNY